MTLHWLSSKRKFFSVSCWGTYDLPEVGLGSADGSTFSGICWRGQHAPIYFCSSCWRALLCGPAWTSHHPPHFTPLSLSLSHSLSLGNVLTDGCQPGPDRKLVTGIPGPTRQLSLVTLFSLVWGTCSVRVLLECCPLALD